MSKNSHLQSLLLERRLSVHVCQTAALTAAGGASRRCLMIVAVDKHAVLQQNILQRKAKHFKSFLEVFNLSKRDIKRMTAVNGARLEG